MSWKIKFVYSARAWTYYRMILQNQQKEWGRMHGVLLLIRYHFAVLTVGLCRPEVNISHILSLHSSLYTTSNAYGWFFISSFVPACVWGICLPFCRKQAWKTIPSILIKTYFWIVSDILFETDWHKNHTSRKVNNHMGFISRTFFSCNGYSP